MNRGPITVIVPVYRGVEETRACLESVLRHASGDRGAELLIIDDASPEPGMAAGLDRIAASSDPEIPITLVRNDENAGFVAAVNDGLGRTTGDVVLLNADCIVTAGWLDRLAGAADEDSDVATVTPLTNSGSICSLPADIIEAFELHGPTPRIDECAAFVAEHSLQLLPEIVAGVGFCMYITRQAIEQCGLFDEESFGPGYGEEVDFCLRATRLGFRHLAEDSTFVYHRGGVSFAESGSQRRAEGSRTLHSRYPYFRAANTRERAADPLEVPFAALTLGGLERRPGRLHVLHVLHSPSPYGGTEKHLGALMEILRPEVDFSILHPAESAFVLRTAWTGAQGERIEEEFLLPGAPASVRDIRDISAGEALRMALDLFDVDLVHVQNLIGHSLTPLSVLAESDQPVVVSVHDLYLACPHHWLLYRNQEACGIPDDLEVCAECLPETLGRSPRHLEEYRATAASLVTGVDRWVFPSRSAADHLLRAYDLDPQRVEIIEHGSLVDVHQRPRDVDETTILEGPLRLAFVGSGWAKKGMHVANDLARAFADTDVEIHHFGERRERPESELRCHGPYDNDDLGALLHQAGIQIVLLPGPYPETFGLVMTEALVAGCPVIGAGYGALGERIRRLGVGWTIDPVDLPAIRALVERLDRCRLEVLRAAQRAASTPIESVADTAHRYMDLYRGLTRPTASTTSRGRR